jgi:hypothetical protein
VASAAAPWDHRLSINPKRKQIVRKLVIAFSVSAIVGIVGLVGWQASAAAPAGAIPHAGRYTPIHPAACAGRNVDCPPGQHRVCGPEGHRCWCAPC